MVASPNVKKGIQSARQLVVTLDDFVKRYGQVEAVRGISFGIECGEIFGLLGPNGAGKTTTLESMCGLRAPSEGSIRILGLDPQADHTALVRHVGIQPQEASLFPNLKVMETLSLFASFHQESLQPEAVLEMIGLTSKRNELVKRLSGGQRQRLLIGVALVANPQILFLDEPTGSLDPQARRQLWDVIRDVREHGTTVVLTTHSMEEAQALCDRVAIIDHGRIVALGSPTELIQAHFPEQVVVCEAKQAPDVSMLQDLPGVVRAAVSPLETGFEIRLWTRQPEQTLKELLALPGAVQGIRMEQGTLEDVFLAITGRSIRDGEA